MRETISDVQREIEGETKTRDSEREREKLHSVC